MDNERIDIPLVGRVSQCEALDQHIRDAFNGKTRVVNVLGVPGSGLGTFMDWLAKSAAAMDFEVCRGEARDQESSPMAVIREAMGEHFPSTLEPPTGESVSFRELFWVHNNGLLLAHRTKITKSEDWDEDIVAGMLGTIENFVGDSLKTRDDRILDMVDQTRKVLTEQGISDDNLPTMLSSLEDFVADAFSSGGEQLGLERLEYGNLKILIEHGTHTFLVGVFTGAESLQMRSDLNSALAAVEERLDGVLRKWDGDIDDLDPANDILEGVMDQVYAITRNLEPEALNAYRLEAVENLTGVIETLAKGKPLLLVLERLHMADEDTLRLIMHISRNLVGSRVLIASSVDIDSMEAGGPLMETCNLLRSEGLWHEERMAPLSKTNIEELLRQAYPGAWFPAAFITRLAQDTDGLPLLIMEGLKALVEDGVIFRDNGSWRAKGLLEVILPSRISDLITLRLSTLSKDESAVLEGGAILGTSFRFSQLKNLLQMEEDDLVNALDSLVRGGHLKEGSLRQDPAVDALQADDEDYIFNFQSGSIRRVLYEGLSRIKRERFHLRASEYLVSSVEKGAMTLDQTAFIAHHYCNTRKKDKALQYSELAAQKAIDGMYPEKALVHLWQAFKAAASMGKDLMYQEWQADILRRLLRQSTLIHSLDETMKAGELLLELSKEMGKPHHEMEARKWMGECLFDMGKWHQAMENFEASLMIARELSDLGQMAQCHRYIGRTHMKLGEFDLALHSLNLAQDFASMEGKLWTMIAANTDMGDLLLGQGKPAQALGFHMESLKALERLPGDTSSFEAEVERARVHFKLGEAHLALDELDLAQENLQKAHDVSKSIGHKLRTAWSGSMIARIMARRGKHQSALELAQMTSVALRRARDDTGLAFSLLSQGEALEVGGKQAEALVQLEEATSIFMRKELALPLIQTSLIQGRILLNLGRTEQGEEVLAMAEEKARKLENQRMLRQIERLLIR